MDEQERNELAELEQRIVDKQSQLLVPKVIVPEINVPVIPEQSVAPVLRQDAFQDRMNDVKMQLLDDAQEKEEFKQKVQTELKEALLKAAQLEKEKQELEKQAIKYRQELLDTKQKENKHTQAEDKWINKQKRRQFHYDGVKDIMIFIGIKQPMNLLLLYFLTLISLPVYLLSKLVKGTIGNLLTGADAEDRSKGVKAFIWTLLAIFLASIIALGVYLSIKWIGGL